MAGLFLLASYCGCPAVAGAAQRPMAVLADSVKEVAAVGSPGSGPDAAKPTIVRTSLSGPELAAPMTFEVALKMRNLAELQARIGKGEIISPAEMAARYYPLTSDYEAAIAWIEGLGLKVTSRYDNHLAFFVQGSVSGIRDSLRVSFARVSYLGREFTSAVSAPSVPPDLAPKLAGINGLQPHLRMRHHHTRLRANTTSSNEAPYVPANLAMAYNATGLSVTGAGQTIGLIGYAFPATNDLTLFWQTCGIAQSASSIVNVPVGVGPSTNPDSDDLEEITLDVEWSSSMAPGASVRVYGIPYSDGFGDQAYQMIISDLPSQPQMRQISVSYGSGEDQMPSGQIQTDSQYLATIAAAGVTLFFSSDDGGSRLDPTTGGYVASDPVQVCYPASDPSVTGVGGTSLVAGNPYGPDPDYAETVWNSNGGASGGGLSTWFDRPTWQTGEGVPAVNQRSVPDVASSADPSYGAFVMFNGIPDTIGGTSWSSPTWAGFCALFNQARTAANLAPIGMMNPKIYPLLGGPCFQDITSGNNGDYSAQPGYDNCTGLGSPNVGLLVEAFSIASPSSVPPKIDVQPSGQSVTGGQDATFSVVVASFSATTYQWQRLAAGAVAWTNLSDTGAYSGTATGVLVVDDASTGMAGDQFRCVITNTVGSTVSLPVTLNVAPVAPPPVSYTGFGDLVVTTQGSSAQVGSYEYEYAGNVAGPVTLQWYHDGQPVAGATSSYLAMGSVAYSDAGDYVLAATNPGGTVATYQEQLIVESPANSNAWIDAQQQGTVVYFLVATPAQVERYDLAAGAWLSPVSLVGSPTAFRVTSGGVYVSTGRTTYKYSLDLSTYAPVANTAITTTVIFVYGNYLYLLGTPDGGQTGTYASFDLSTGAAVATTNGELDNSYLNEVGVSNELGMVFGRGKYSDPANLASLALNPDGTVSPVSSNDFNFSLYRGGSLVYVFPGGQLVADNGGTVYHGADLSAAGSFSAPFDDLGFLSDGNIAVVRGDEITLYGPGSFPELGRALLSGGAQRIFSYGSVITAFSQPAASGGAITVQTVNEAQVSAQRPTAPVVSGTSVSFIPDDAFMDATGLVYLYSKIYRSFFVWSASTRQYVDTIPLQGSPALVSYSANQNRIYLAYDDGRITRIDLAGANKETPFANTPTVPDFFSPVDSQVYVVLRDAVDSGERQRLYDSNGNIVATGSTGYYSQPYWSSAEQAIFDIPTVWWEQIEKIPVSAGVLGPSLAPRINTVDSVIGSGPVRLSADSSELVTGSGIVYDTTTLSQTGVLGTSFVDAAWVGPAVTTIDMSGSGSLVQQWAGSNYLPSNSVTVPGFPLRIWRTPDGQLLALTVVGGTAHMTPLDSSGNLLTQSGPAISVQPTGQVSNSGSTVVFTTGSPGAVTYQWQCNGANLGDGLGVSGSKGPQLVLDDVSAANAGSYSCVVTSSIGSSVTNGANLVVQTSTTPGSVTSLSSRAFVGTGNNILIGGFYVVGGTSRTVLVQAIGPALAASPYNVSGTLQHPALSIHQYQGGKDVVLRTNTGWGSNPVLSDAAAEVYAQPTLQPGSADSEILVTLPPGGYTAEVQGADGGTGVALVAIYELP